MQFEKYVTRMQYLQKLIENQCTGTPKEVANKLGISERMLFRYIKNLKSNEEQIKFNRIKKSYIFVRSDKRQKDRIRIEYFYTQS